MKRLIHGVAERARTVDNWNHNQIAITFYSATYACLFVRYAALKLNIYAVHISHLTKFSSIYRLFLLAWIVLTLPACGGNSSQEHFREASNFTALWITKGAVKPYTLGETTPVVFGGELLYVGAFADSSGLRTRIYRQSDNALLWDGLTGMGMVSAIVESGTLYIFGANANSSGGTRIEMISTQDMITWSPKVSVFTAPPGTLVFNTSIAPDPTGFVMVYEVCEGGMVCFNARFLHSTDLRNWVPIGGLYEWGYYTACPTIRYVDGYYYLFYLSHFNGDIDLPSYHATNISRSTDLRNWQFSPSTVLSPLDGGDAALNASDMDLIEIGGTVQMVYGNGSQFGAVVPNSGLREASFNGTLAQFVLMFFL